MNFHSPYADTTNITRKYPQNTEKEEMPVKNTDVLIIGGGAAGLTAAVYASRAGLETTVIENNIPGGQIANAQKIGNYPGFEEISGEELTCRLISQAERNGAVFEEFDPICGVDLKKKHVRTRSELYKCRSIIIASGSVPRKLEIDGAERLEGKSIHYCAACDGAFYKGKHTAVIGGGNSAVEGAISLSDTAGQVTLLVRGERLKAENVRINELNRRKNITVRFGFEPVSVGQMNGRCIIEPKKGGQLECDGIFVFIGSDAATEFLGGQLETDGSGYIVTDDEMKTAVPGIFAAGDVRSKKIRQLTTAAADGTIAALSAQKYLSENQEEHNG